MSKPFPRVERFRDSDETERPFPRGVPIHKKMSGAPPRRLAALVLACLYIACTPGLAGTFTEVIAFGDSLSDSGNVYALTGGWIPASPYWQGRFSNGPTWAEVLAAQLGLADPAARWDSVGERTNYAVGGAKTDHTEEFFGVIGMDRQVGWFQNDLLNDPSWDVSDALFVVWGGGNDYMGYLDSGGPLPTPAANLRQRMETLIGLGAERFVTCNLPPLGDAPKYRGTSKEAQADQLSQTFAVELQQQVNELSALNPQCTFYYLDVYNVFQDILANPGDYGLTNVTDPAFDGSSVVPNPDQYLFWDSVHPTRVGHVLLGVNAFNHIVPEPGSVVLLWLGLPALLGLRRKPGASGHCPPNPLLRSRMRVRFGVPALAGFSELQRFRCNRLKPGLQTRSTVIGGSVRMRPRKPARNFCA